MEQEKEKTARSLIIQYLESCMASDAEHSEEIGYSVECLKNAWGIETPEIKIPGVSSIIDLIPTPKYDSDRAFQLKNEGNAALSRGELDTAIQFYTQAISVDPTQSTFYCNRAAVYSKKNEHENAITDCEKFNFSLKASSGVD